MKIIDKIFKKDNDPVMDENIILPPFNEELTDFIDVPCIKWLFNYTDEQGTIYVYKITYPIMSYLYASVKFTQSKQYSIRIFSYTGDDLNKDNLFKVKRGKHQINYCITSNEMKIFGPSNNYGFSYELLWNKIIEEYWKCVDEEKDK